ncbi:hypothetical protein VTN77DRAFT_6798 [Rasamsonia byssochlamydoides]|uniref:uncharacterized protein n=1 Tax=Rasamsonia byssochlamydoides TaxID=89139 RepID=UPI003742297F
MVSLPNKRQQARNERALQELIRTVPGNDRCADCQARNPGWASWNLGVFLCMRCAALHRKMGTHISKVKSLSMDSWTSEQVENMRKNGNVAVNKIYNPRNVKPPVPIDIDEADSAMERFIRQKYEHRVLEDGKPKPPSRDDSSYHTYKSSEDSPPPLPPKSGRKFGFGLRSVSSTSHLPRSSERASTPTSPSHRSETFSARSPPIPINKQSRVFGASIGEELSSSFESKLAVLRDMGFPDDKRNATILKGLSGNLEKTIESLIRLGEGSSPGSRARTPVTKPTSQPSPSANASSTNPFDLLDVTNPTQQKAPVKSYNPFDVPTTTQPSSSQSLEASFQNLQVSQPLFPHSTGGYPSSQGPAVYQQPLTPPVFPSSQAPFVSSPQPLNGNYNPFFQSTIPAQTTGGNPYSSQTRSLSSTNPFFGHASTQAQFAPSTSASAFPGQSQPGLSQQRQYTDPMPSFSSSVFSQPQQQQYSSPQTSSNPFESMTATTNPSMTFQQPQAQPQSFFPSQSNVQIQVQQPQTTRIDKNSILALYNLPQQQPSSSTTEQTQQMQRMQQPSEQSQFSTGPSPAPSLLTNSLGSTPQTQSPFNMSTPQHSATMPESLGSPTAATRNPFFNSTTQFSGQSPGSAAPSGLGIGLGPKSPQINNMAPRGHMSQGSVDINGLQNGRHSPDAFASLSARYAQ